MIVNYNSQRKKVFLIFSDLSLGGVQTKMIHLANALVAQGIDCWIFLEEKGKYPRICLLDKRVKIVVSLNIKIFNKRPFYGWRFMFFVSLFAMYLRPASLFVSLAPLATQLLFFLSRMCPSLVSKIVVNEDTLPAYEYEGIRYSSLRRRIKMYYPKTKSVIAVSESTYNNLREQFKIPSPPLTFLSNWASFASALWPSGRRRDIDLLYAGRLDAQKQPKALANVLSGVLKKRPRTTIRVYGDGKELDIFKERLKTLGIYNKIFVSTPAKNIRTLLTRSKFFLFTSRYEGLPFAGVEAMREGAVVACLEAPGLRDMVRDGNTGVIKQSIPFLVEDTVRLLDNPKALHRIQLAAFRYAKKNYSERNEELLMRLMLE